MISAPRTIVVRSKTGDETLGFISVDSTIDGRSRGGLRLMPDVSQEELEKLARTMTLKYGFLGLPQGGAKGGVLGDPDAPSGRRAQVLGQFATAASAVLAGRTYVPDADMGTTGPEIQRMLEGIGVRVARREYRGTRSGDYTAGTVFEAARAAATVQGLELRACRVAIEGFGKVGGSLAEMFVCAGARVVAVSTRQGAVYNPRGLDVAALRARAGTVSVAAMADGLGDVLAVSAVKAVPAEIFCPCARHDSVGPADVAAMPARVVSCGANCPIAPDAERLLWDRGVLCVPDFVANSGGVLGGTLEFAGWRAEEIFAFFEERYRPRVARLIAQAQVAGAGLRALAEAEALARFADVKRQAERGSSAGRAAAAALSIYREGWLPRRLVRRLSQAYFERRLA